MKKNIIVIVFLIMSLTVVSSLIITAQDSFKDEWVKMVQEAKLYSDTSRDYWTMPQFNEYISRGAEVLSNLEEMYKGSNDYYEKQLALHLIGEITQDAERVWRLFYNNRKNEQNRLNNFVVQYLRSYRNPEYITFCSQQLMDENSAEFALRVFAWQGDQSRVQEIVKYFERTKDIEALYALGEIGDISAMPLLRKYLNSPDLYESKAAFIALGLMGDKESVKIVFYQFYRGQDENYYDSNSRSVLEGVQSREVIEWLIEDAVENSESISILARISGRAHLSGIKNPTIADLVVYFSDNPDRWEAELTEIKAWWNMKRPNWVEPKKRIYIEPKTPVLGSIPEDLIWLDPMEGFCP